MALEPINNGDLGPELRAKINSLIARNQRIGFAIGDSITFQNSDNNAGLWGGNCYWSVLSWLSGGRIVFRGQAGIPGNTSAQIATRFADEALTYPNIDLMFIMAGTNDVTSSVAQATTIANIVSMIRASLSRGQVPIVLSVLPRGDNAGYNTTTIALNAALQPAIEAAGAVWVDVFTPVAASGYAVGSANTPDGIHPNPPAVKIMAETALARLEALYLIAPEKAWNLLPADQYGGAPSSDFTSTYTQSGYGTVPTGYIMGSGVATTTVSADATSGAQLMNIAATSGTVQFTTSSAFSLARFAGKTVAFSGRLKTSGLESSGSKVRIRLQGSDTETNVDLRLQLLYDLAIDGDGYFYGETFVPASASSATAAILVDIITGGACTVSVGEFTIRVLQEIPQGLLGTRMRRIPRNVRTVATATTLTVDDNILYVDATAGAVTITLPTAGKALYGAGSYTSTYQKGMPTQGLDFTIIKKDASANAVTVQRAGSDTINGGTSVNTTTQYGRINPICVARTVWVA